MLTAIGSLKRAGNRAPEIRLFASTCEAAEIAQSVLDNVRRMSQALHPAIVDEADLASTLNWFLPTIERHSGISVSYESRGFVLCQDRTAFTFIASSRKCSST